MPAFGVAVIDSEFPVGQPVTGQESVAVVVALLVTLQEKPSVGGGGGADSVKVTGTRIGEFVHV